MMFPFIFVNSIWIIPLHSLGWFLFQSKLLAFKPIHDWFFKLYTGNDNLALELLVDYEQLNFSIYSEICFEALPQLIIQSINAAFMAGTNYPVGVIEMGSLSFSGIIVLDGVYKVVFYKAIKEIDLVDAPTGFEGYGSSLAGISTVKKNKVERSFELPMFSNVIVPKEKSKGGLSENKYNKLKKDLEKTKEKIEKIESALEKAKP